MVKPIVSIAMVTYNHAPYIVEAIEGVLRQKTGFPIELVIGDDYSTDRTREIILDYQKKNPEIIRIIPSDKNVGAKKNFFRTTKSCRGKYIAFCEGDDYWHPADKLHKQVEYLESHPKCGLLFTDCDVYYDGSGKVDKNYNRSKGFVSPVNLTIEQIMGDGLIKWTCTAIIRRSLFETIVESDPILHQSGKFLMGDTQIWTEAALVSDVFYIPETSATYRRLGESASRSDNPVKRWQFWKSAAEMKLYLCDKHKLPEKIRQKQEAAWCDFSLWLAFYTQNAALAEEVRKKKEAFSWKEWLRYFGAKNIMVWHAYLAVSRFCGLFRKKNDQAL
ncbi:MAG TPA: hypothetical protein DCL44_11050 [Elusimicrobia bacterium]|nr:hypothetical protein [Elusimicrobiota bacterium]